MKLAILGATLATLAFTLPASADHFSNTPAVGTKTTSAAAGYVSPNGMVNGSTSLATGDARNAPIVLGSRYYPRYDTYAMNSPVYLPDREENVIITEE